MKIASCVWPTWTQITYLCPWHIILQSIGSFKLWSRWSPFLQTGSMKFSIDSLILTNLINQSIFKSLTWKHCIFTSIYWRIKSFYRLATILKQKYNAYHVNNLKSTVHLQFTLSSNYNVKKIIIGNIFYSKLNFVPS